MAEESRRPSRGRRRLVPWLNPALHRRARLPLWQVLALRARAIMYVSCTRARHDRHAHPSLSNHLHDLCVTLRPPGTIYTCIPSTHESIMSRPWSQLVSWFFLVPSHSLRSSLLRVRREQLVSRQSRCSCYRDEFSLLCLIDIYRFPGNARRYANKNQDFTFVNFNLTAGTSMSRTPRVSTDHAPDLTPLFNWNTKQLFLYVSAEYENKRGVSVAHTKPF